MLFAFFEPVGPTASSLVQRQKAFIAITVQFSCDDILYSVSIAAINRGGYLSRPGRLGEHLADLAPYAPEPDFTPLFNGFSMEKWKMAGPGRFRIFSGALQSVPGNDIATIAWPIS